MRILPMLILLALAGCTGTVGPYVADIRELPDGRLEVTRCTTTVTHSGDITCYETGNCTKKTIGRPAVTAASPIAAEPSSTSLR